MYIISKFESFSNQPNIEEIKDIFQELVDKWDMVFEGDSNCSLISSISSGIGYNLFTKKEDISSYHRYINIGKEIENIENVYLIIHCDLYGSNDFYTTLYEFNNDCEDLLKRFQSEFNCQLLTAYGSQYLQSKGIVTSRFIFIFRN